MIDIVVTEVTASGDGHYMMAVVDGVEYKVRHDDPCTWENRDIAFQELLELIPEDYRLTVKEKYDRYCDGLRNAEVEAERLANMTEEERLAMFQEQMESVNTTNNEEVYEKTEE